MDLLFELLRDLDQGICRVLPPCAQEVSCYYYSKRWNDVYLFDNSMQCSIAMEDIEYAKWLTDQPCYIDEDDVLEWN